MDWLRKASSPFKSLNLLATAAILALLTACGSGGFSETDPGNPTTPGGTDNIVVTLQLVQASDGAATSTITSANPGRVIATVTGISQPVIVTFETDIASIPVPTAITDGSNQATVDILAGSSLGAGTVSASVSSGENASLVYAVGATNVLMGSGSPFQQGVAEIGTAQISAGGTTTVSVTIVDESGTPFTQPVEVNFSSSCSSANNPTATLSSPITTVNGVASSTYLAQGCVGDDPINVTANAGGINLSASGSVNILPANVGSIEFVSATPESIVIQGAGGIGGSESSTVVFRVRDTNNGRLAGQLVNFSLNSQSGGIEMSPLSATSNSDGLVQTVINSGTVSASVRVTATIDGSDPAISTQSSNLVVSTGIPDQDSFTLAANVLNPEGGDIVGTEVEVTAFLADGFNNPVPDGTTVSFSTEGGRIDPSCTTTSGQCTVTWNSQNPNPIGGEHNSGTPSPYPNNLYQGGANEFSLGQPYGGRATIIATAVGEESFPDLNGNGRFDNTEMDTFLNGTDVGGNGFDLDEAYRDHNEDGFFNPWETDAGEEPGGDLEILVDFNSDSSWTLADNLYNGVLCSEPAHAGCATQKSVHVRSQLVLVMSGSTPYITLSKVIDEDGFVEIVTNAQQQVTYFVDGVEDAAPNTNALRRIDLSPDSSGAFSVIISDIHNQPMPAGTTVEFETSVGELTGAVSTTWPSSNKNGGTEFSLGLKAPGQVDSGTVQVNVTTPSGLETVYTILSVSVQ